MAIETASEKVNIFLSDDYVTCSELPYFSLENWTTYVNSHVTSSSSGLHATLTQLLISDQDYAMMVVIYSVLCSAITFSGCLGNTIIIVTFLSLKLKDGVVISFLCLSISDFLYDFTILAHMVSLGLFVLERKSSFKIWFPFDPFGIYVFFSDIAVLIYLMTVLATTFIAVIRCLCVAKPLHFRNILTRRRSIFCASLFGVLVVASYIPILLNMTMEKSFDLNINATRYMLWISPLREKIKLGIWISRDVLITLITEIVVLICVVVMAKNVRAAAKFRHKTATKYSVRPNLTEIALAETQEKSRNKSQENPNDSKGFPASSTSDAHSTKLNSKDFAVVRQVVLISFVYIICNMPKILIDLAVLFMPDLTLGRPPGPQIPSYTTGKETNRISAVS